MPQRPRELEPYRSLLHYFGARLRHHRDRVGWSQAQLGRKVYKSGSLIRMIEVGERSVDVDLARRLDEALDAHGELVSLEPWTQQPPSHQEKPIPETSVLGGEPAVCDETDDELEALELARRVDASDASMVTLDGLGVAVHGLCRSYATTQPRELLTSVRHHRQYVSSLLDARTTLAQRRQLMVTGGWLSLLAACVLTDLGKRRAAVASQRTAFHLGQHAGAADVMSWAYEVHAWQALLDGRYEEAVDLCRTGQNLVSEGTSPYIQLTAQEGRAWARQKNKKATRESLDRAAASLSRMSEPCFPDHHFSFDPRKLTSYAATTLTWLEDGETAEEAEAYAREVIRQQEQDTSTKAPRRLATARIDLALTVAEQDRPEEACHLGNLALDSGRLVQSNIWRVGELARSLGQNYGGLSATKELHERYIETRRNIGNP